ncbi:MAG: hypothetical protein HPY75_12600 [Actinobacteria bacterium]|nr:hypothetical protein [Actinomycetota bacterium]
MYCDECGLPRGVGKANEWKPNGTIVSRYEADLRGVFVDAGELGHLVSSLSDRMGYDVSRLVTEGKRKDSAHYARGLIERMRNSGSALPEAGDFMRMMAANYAVPGFGKVTILDFRDDGSVVLDMEGAYNLPMALGQTAGVYEAVLGTRGDVDYEGDEKQSRVIILPREGNPELERRIESEVEQAPTLSDEGDAEYKACPRCSAPLELSRALDWKVEDSLIVEKRSGRRFVFDNVRGLTAVMRLLVDELGEDVERMLAEIARDYARAYYSDMGKGISFQDESSRMALFGWGLPAGLEKSGEGFTLRLINPFYGPLMAGRIWGLVETLGENELELGEYDWSETAVAQVTLTAA